MVILGVQLSDDVLPALHAAGQRHGGVTEAMARYVIEGLVREGLYQPTDSTSNGEDVDALDGALMSFLDEAMSRVRQMVPVGETFSLNADHPGAIRLFTKEEWQQLNIKPTAYGRAFKTRVTAELADPYEKSSQNKQIYRRRS
ncbi:MAG TPA: hypothetical protein VFZ09_36130 [Archangium sp.]|uniref:hypothetical protein n=1 Tax=Archangium sp. TaxID=1872627 RepID=UPI002E336F22|nr:hypothetical protein [Archangium sp.]HEX5751705.1 hypothetical protein [Archangium sp.]